MANLTLHCIACVLTIIDHVNVVTLHIHLHIHGSCLCGKARHIYMYIYAGFHYIFLLQSICFLGPDTHTVISDNINTLVINHKCVDAQEMNVPLSVDPIFVG